LQEQSDAAIFLLAVTARLLHSVRNDIIYGMDKHFYVYIMTNKNNTVLYTGITNDLRRRVYEHKHKLVDGFTKKYNITKLVYYEVFRDAENAIFREKHIKAGSREKKVALINALNPRWKDLYEEL
jgi:putative endonuclease